MVLICLILRLYFFKYESKLYFILFSISLCITLMARRSSRQTTVRGKSSYRVKEQIFLLTFLIPASIRARSHKNISNVRSVVTETFRTSPSWRSRSSASPCRRSTWPRRLEQSHIQIYHNSLMTVLDKKTLKSTKNR